MPALPTLFRTTFVFLALAAALVSADSHEHKRHDAERRHRDHAATERATHLEKRFDNTRFTFYDVGINACGGFDHPGDFVRPPAPS